MATQLKQRSFRPHPAATVVSVIFTALFVGLGVWQLDRIGQKERMAADFEAQRGLPVVDVANVPVDIEDYRYRNATAIGEFVGMHQILIDNVVFDGQPGYQVLTPMRLEDTDRYLLIDRGWLAQGAKRGVVPDMPPATGVIPVSGWLDYPRSTPVIIPGPVESEKTLWPYLDMEALAARLGAPLPNFVIHATDDAVLRHKDPEFDAKSGMHIGYAIQWFAFAVAAAGTYIAVSMRRPA